MNNEFHKPFIQSLIIITIVTVFAMVSSRYLIQQYDFSSFSPQKNIEYSSQKSQEEARSTFVE